MPEVTIIVPAQDLTGVGEGLVKLTAEIANRDSSIVSHGMLGGEFGYGAIFENDIFTMHPFCWCEKHECLWCKSCECSGVWRDKSGVEHESYEDGREWVLKQACKWYDPSNPDGSDHAKTLPNFHFKPSGFKVWWYKYIGRGMELEGGAPDNWLRMCLQSLHRT